MKIAKSLYYIIVLLLPVNLGKHFILRQSYVGGILVDYLVPTVYLIDLLIFLLLLFWLNKSYLQILTKELQKTYFFRILLLFLFASLMSSFLSPRPFLSYYVIFKWILYASFLFYTYLNASFDKVIKMLAFSTIFLGILAILQFVLQGSVFDNYIFFGEQPYSTSTRSIVLENVNGVHKVPAYGLFRHPNVFGGYLSIILMWIYFAYQHEKVNKKIYLLSFFLGLTALFLTFSQLALFSFVFGFFPLLLGLFRNSVFKKILLISFIVCLLGGLLFPWWNSFFGLSGPSVDRRVNLLQSSYTLFLDNPFFGVGIGQNTVLIEKYMPLMRDLRFVQPVHNIFALVLSEVGLFGFFFFVTILLYCIYLSYQKASIFLISLMQITFLGSFDHYFLTHQQTFLLFLLTLGLALTYNRRDYA